MVTAPIFKQFPGAERRQLTCCNCSRHHPLAYVRCSRSGECYSVTKELSITVVGICTNMNVSHFRSTTLGSKFDIVVGHWKAYTHLKYLWSLQYYTGVAFRTFACRLRFRPYVSGVSFSSVSPMPQLNQPSCQYPCLVATMYLRT